jgi:hypothetical protein
MICLVRRRGVQQANAAFMQVARINAARGVREEGTMQANAFSGLCSLHLPTNAERSGGGVISTLMKLGYLLDYYTTIDDDPSPKVSWNDRRAMQE